eukprot:362987-Chlamydomonas_euryale.AAC.2
MDSRAAGDPAPHHWQTGALKRAHRRPGAAARQQHTYGPWAQALGSGILRWIAAQDGVGHLIPRLGHLSQVTRACGVHMPAQKQKPARSHLASSSRQLNAEGDGVNTTS